MTVDSQVARSLRTDVRNPLLALPGMKILQGLPCDQRMFLRSILLQIAADARLRAEKCWRTHKAPMALYWKCVAVYTGHIARALR